MPLRPSSVAAVEPAGPPPLTSTSSIGRRKNLMLASGHSEPDSSEPTARMFERFRFLATSEPDAPALVDGTTGRILSRKDVLDLSRASAERLRGTGLSRGDLVAVQLPNSAEFIATWLAALEIGLVIIPIDRDASNTE